MRFLCSSLVILLTALACFGQAFTPRRPFVYGSSVVTTNPTSFKSLAYWWVASDCTNDAPVTNWVDRIQGAVMTQSDPVRRPQNTTNGIYFTPTNILITADGFSIDHPMAWMVIMSFEGDGMIWRDYYSTSYGAQGMHISSSKLWQIEDVTSLARSVALLTNRLYCFLGVPTNSAGTLSVPIYTNGVFDGYYWNEAGKALTKLMAFGADSVYEPPGSRIRATIREIAVWTNALTNINNVFPGEIVPVALWEYATNTYPTANWYAAPTITVQPVSVVTLTNTIAQFTVTATGDPGVTLRYRWQTNGVNLADSTLWAGTATNTLWVTNGPTEFSNLLVRCVISNSFGPASVTSAVVALTVVRNLSEAPYLLWAMEEGSGTNVADLSGNGFDGRFYASPTWEAGKVGSYSVGFHATTGAQRDGVYANTLTNLGFPNGAVTWWAYMTNAYNCGKLRWFWSVYRATGADDFTGMIFTDNKWYLGFYDGGDEKRMILDATAGNCPQSNWVHYAFSWTATNSVFYQNAVALATNSTAVGGTNLSAPFWIGSSANSVGAPYYDGRMDDVRVYTNGLSSNDVYYLYHTIYAQP